MPVREFHKQGNLVHLHTETNIKTLSLRPLKPTPTDILAQNVSGCVQQRCAERKQASSLLAGSAAKEDGKPRGVRRCTGRCWKQQRSSSRERLETTGNGWERLETANVHTIRI